jgi:hypothetical protein
MHSYIFPISTADIKSKSLHVCLFLCTEKVENRIIVRRKGTLVLDADNCVILSEDDVNLAAAIMPQKLSWDVIVKSDDLILSRLNWLKDHLPKGKPSTRCVLSCKEKELQSAGWQILKYTDKCAIVRGEVLFHRYDFKEGRHLWTRTYKTSVDSK